MIRHVVAGLLGLALAGCAQNRSAMQSRGPSGGPVGLTSFPSIHETINRENPKFDPRSLRASAATHGPGSDSVGSTPAAAMTGAPSPSDSRRPELGLGAGVATPSVNPAAVNPAPPATDIALEMVDTPSPSASAGSAHDELGAAHSHPADPTVPPSGPAPETEVPATAGVTPPATSDGSLPPAMEGGANNQPEPSMPEAPPTDGTLPAPTEPPPVADTPSLPAPVEEGGASIPPLPEESPATPAPAPLPEPGTGNGALAAPVESGSAPAPTPDAIPELPAPTESAPSADSVPPIAVPADSPTGAVAPPSESPATNPPASEAPSAPPALEAPPEMPPPPELPAFPPAADSEPAPSSAPTPAPAPASEAGAGATPPKTSAAPGESDMPALPPMLPLPPAEPAATQTEAPPKNDSAASEGKHDPAVQQTAADSTMIQSRIRPRNAQSAGDVAARVGDEVITLNQLRKGVQQRLQAVDPSQPPSEQEIRMVAYSVLQELIERSIVVQEAKRELKKPEAIKMVMADAEKSWREEELSPMLRKYSATNEYELKEKLKEHDVSLDEMRDTYCKHHLSQSFMKAKIGPKMTVSLPEMREYYMDHLHDFDRPAQIVWREVVIDFDKCKTRTEAHAKAEAALARLRRGEDFAKVASAESHGPNKAKGGLWETSPGGYGVDAVNTALDTLALGQISQIIEAPASYHIVRVERRRAAGPASFAEVEVQDKIKNTIFNEKIRRETSGFIAKLRKQTLISMNPMFEPARNDPATIQTGMPR